MENNRPFSRKEWNHLQGANQLVMTNVLNTMYHGMVEGLTNGDLAARYSGPNESAFTDAIKAHHSLTKTPGNYV